MPYCRGTGVIKNPAAYGGVFDLEGCKIILNAMLVNAML